MQEQLRAAVLPELEARVLEQQVRARLFRRGDEAVQFGRYRLLERLGQGGMGVVFSAYDGELDRRVALKLLHPTQDRADATSRARLRREAQALARLSHPNVVQVFEIGEVGEQVFVAMEFVRGVTARAWLAQKTRSVDEVLEVYLQAGRGLAAAHAAGLVHRDFKPDNIMVGEDGRVRVVDFGLVRGDEGEARAEAAALQTIPDLTQTGAILGTPAYMAPEQALGDGAAIDARSDQFGFCVALYEALYGERPFAGDSFVAYRAAVLRGEVRPAPPRSPVSARIRQALLRGLGRAPDERWPAMEALLAALDRRAARARVRTLGLATLLAVTLVGLVFAGLAGWRALEASRREAAAEQRYLALAERWTALLGAGDRPAAEALLAAFVAAPEVEGTAVAADVRLRWARELAARGIAAPEAWAGAFVEARDRAARRAALLGLGEAFRGARRWAGIASAVALLGAEEPDLLAAPEVLGLRFDVATYERDIPAALALARDPAAPPEVRATAPVLERFARMTRTPYVDIEDTTPVRTADGPALVLDMGPPGVPRVLIETTATPALAERWRAPAPGPVVGAADGPAAALGHDGDGLVLAALAAGGPRPLQRWPGVGPPLGVHAVDLDRDGHAELYYSEFRSLRALVRDGDGWRRTRPHAGTEAANSDIGWLTSGDLDGDALPELVVAFGPWSAYDVRVFRAGSPGELTLVARRKLGALDGAQVLRTPAGPRLVVRTTGNFGNSTVFPPERRAGAPKGYYVLRLAGDALVLERSLPIVDTPDDPRRSRTFRVGDVDGDGLDDLVADFLRGGKYGPEALLEVFRQLPDGGFALLSLHGLHFSGLVELDGEPGRELLVTAIEDRTLWLVGSGPQPLGPAPAPNLALAGAHTQELVGAGAPAEVVALAQAGASELALATATQVAAHAPTPARRRLHLAAARIAEDLERRDQASALLADAAEEPSLRAGALARQVALELASGRIEQAAAAAAAWSQAPGLAVDERARADQTAARLARLASGRVVVSKLVSGTDGPSLAEPSALRREAGALILDSFTGLRTALAWPLAWSREPLQIDLTLTPRELQWSSSVELRLVVGETTIADISLCNRGGDIHHELVARCNHTLGSIWLEEVRLDGAADPYTLRMLVDPAQGTYDCFVLRPGGGFVGTCRARLPALPEGQARLEIGVVAGHSSDPNTAARVELTELAIAGASLVPGADDDPEDLAARLLIDGDHVEALARLDGRDGPRARVWRAVALAELGRLPAAAEALRAALAGPPDAAVKAELLRFFRTRPAAIGPLLREILGEPAYFAWFAESTVNVHHRRRFTQETLRALLSGLGGLERGCAAPAPCWLLLRMRGRALAQSGDRKRARRDLERAVALAPAEPGQARAVAATHVDLAALAAADGDDAAALEHARAALRIDPAIEIARDMLRARPELARLLATPAWQALLGPDDRTLDR